MNVVFIGAGNLATHLSLEMLEKGIAIRQIYSRTCRQAKILAGKLGCSWTIHPEEIVPDADLYIFSLKDAVLAEIIAKVKPNPALWVHTAGSMPMDIFKDHVSRYGVLYPFQTFSKDRKVDFGRIPIFIEANNEEDTCFLEKVALMLSPNVRILSSDKRKILHLSAVFACNFTNHMYTLAARLLAEQNLPFDCLLPLIDETAAKIHSMPPAEAQTGPAIRYDQNVIEKHINLLSSKEMKILYEIISKSIHQESSKSNE